MASGLNKQAINLWGRIESRIGDILPRQAVVVEESPNGGVLVRFATEDSSLTSTWFPSTVDDAPIGTTGWVFPLAGGKGLFVAINTPIPQYDPGAGFPVTSVAGKTGAVTLVKADVGLGNVDNTSDANKPVSTATLTALNLKANTADLGALAAKNAIAVPTDITATGTPSATTYLRGDGQWVTPTNTTYTEISEAEITAGTGTTLRSISGRRIQFAVDKARDGLVLASSLALVATSGSYNDLSNLPTLGTAASQNSTAFATAAQGAKADTAVQPAAIANFETTTQLNARDTANRNRANHTGTQSADTIVDGTTNKAYTATEKTKLAGVAAGAEVNVNADWNAVSGDAQILNKPTLGTAAAQNTTAFATAAQGAKADTAVQPAAIANFETTTQLNARDTANRNRANHTGTQSAATITGLATVATSGAYSDLSGKPTLGLLAAKDQIAVPGDVNATGTASATTYLRGDGAWVTPPNTNTTYTEISEAEITAGTDSTLRTITGRRIQFAIDKARVGVALTANLAAVATSGAYADLTGKPTLGSLAAKNQAAISDIAATGTASASTYLRGDGQWGTPANTTYTEMPEAVITAGTDTVLYAMTGRRIQFAVDKARSGVALTANLAAVATSGSYTDLSNKPTIPAQVNLTAGANVTITGTYPNLTVASSNTTYTEIPEAVITAGTDSALYAISGRRMQFAIDKARSGVALTVNLATVATTGSYTDLSNKPTIPTTLAQLDTTVTGAQLNALKTKVDGIAAGATANDTDANLKNRANHTGTQSADTIVDGTTNKVYTATEKTKLAGIAAGAEVNVNADWTAVSGDAQILNKPTLGSLAAKSTIAVPGDITATGTASASTYLAGDGSWKAAPVTSVAGRTGAITLTKSDVGLANVDNTSDANKPVSTATQTALDAKVTGTALTSALPSTVGTSGQVLQSNGTAVVWVAIPSAPVTSVAGKTGVVTLVKGDVGLGNVDNTSDANKPVSTAQQAALDGKANTSHTHPIGDVIATGTPSATTFLRGDSTWSAAPVTSVAGKTGVVTLAKADVGLGNVDNTSDANKPVSTAQATALAGKAAAVHTHVLGDITGITGTASASTYLRGDGAWASLPSAPVTSVAGKTGAVTLVLGDITGITGTASASTYLAGDGSWKAAPVTSVSGKTGAVSILKGDVGLANVDNTSDANKPISTAQAAAINAKQDSTALLNALPSAVGTNGQILQSNGTSMVWAAIPSAPVTSVAGRTGAVTLTKTDVGLANVDNTSDANKPVSTAQATAINAKVTSTALTNALPSTVGTNGQILQSNGTTIAWVAAPSAPVTSVAGKTGAVTLVLGDITGITGTANSGTYLRGDGTWAAAPVSSVAGRTGAVTLTKSDVGLSSVDNTSDVNKPVSTATQTALNAKLNLAGGTVSGAVNTTAGGSAGAGTQKLATEAYIQSRGTNLVTNGFGTLGNNYNFSGFVYDPVNLFTGLGAFVSSGSGTVTNPVTSNELIPVDPSSTYEMSLYAKEITSLGGTKFYAGIAPYDSDGLVITANKHMRKAGTDTTLAADLAPGDTEIKLTSAANWQNAAGANSYQRSVLIFGYSNSAGYTYPDYTYSRRLLANIYADGGINFTTNTITLTNPWPSTWGTIPAGTAISNATDGGNYKYVAANLATAPSDWAPFSGLIGGIDYSGLNNNSKFPPGTAMVRLMWLPNFSSGTQGGTQGYSAISLRQVEPEISTTEIDAGTANALRSITGRRAQYIVEKAQRNVPNPTLGQYAANKTYVDTGDTAAKARANHTGTQSADTITDGSTNKVFTATEKTKLAGIATGATANDTDANLKNRANHTGTQSAATITGLATVATSGSYNDLSSKPTIPAQVNLTAGANVTITGTYPNLTITGAASAQVNSDWSASSGVAQILNKPSLAVVATSGSYNDLSSKPTIPAQVNLTAGSNVSITGSYPNLTIAATDTTYSSISESEITSGGATLRAITGARAQFMINRANHIGTQSAATITGLATVATSGSYNDLSSKPSIPAQVNLTAGSNVTITGSYPNLTIASSDTQYSEIPESDITGGSAVTLRTLTGRRAGFMMNRANHTGTQTADTITDGTTNKAYTATEKTKLSGIATGATANDTDANLKNRANHTGTQSADTITDGTTNKAYTATEKTKLSGIATGATANSSDATLLNRANHTGTQAAATITGLATVATSGSYNDLSNKPTIPAAQVNSDWNAGSGLAQILNKPTLGTMAAKSAVAISDITATGTASATTYLRGDGQWQTPPSSAVTSVAGKTGAMTLVKGDVGLGNVDNTADSAKPVSTAQQTALDGKQTKTITGTVATAAATAAKTVTISGYTLAAGDILAITYTSGSTAASPTLNVNGTGAKSIYVAGVAASAATHTASSGGVVLYYYNGTRFDMMGSTSNTNTTYSVIPSADITGGTATTGYLITGQRSQEIVNKARSGLSRSVTFDVRDYGTIGTSNDTAVFQAAIDAAYAAGGGVVMVPSGTYTCTSGLYLKHKVTISGPNRASCYLDLRGVVTGTAATSALGVSVALYGGGSFTSLPNLSGNVANNSMTVTFASAHGLAIGDWFCIYNTTDYSFSAGRDYYRDGQFCQVKSVSGNTVTLTAPTFSAYPSASCTVHKMAPMATGMSNITVLVPDGMYGVHFDGCTSLDLDNCEFIGSARGALYIGRSVMIAMTNPKAWSLVPKDGTNTAYGLIIGNSQHISISNPFFSADRHGMATGGSSGVACVPVRDLTVMGGTISTSGNTTFGGDTHGNTEHCWLIGVSYPRGLHVAGDNWHVISCDIEQAPVSEGEAFYGSDLKSHNIEIRNCVFRATTTIGGNGLVYLLWSDTNTVDNGHCQIMGTTIDISSYRNTAGTGAYGLYINQTSALTTGNITVDMKGTATSSSWGNSVLGCYIRATGTGSAYQDVRVTADMRNMGVNVQNANTVTFENCVIVGAPSQGLRTYNMAGTKPVARTKNNVVTGCGNAGIQIVNIGNTGSSRIIVHGDEVMNCNQIGDTSTTLGANIYLYGAQFVSYRDVFTGADESPAKPTRADAIATVGTLFQSPAAIIGGLAQLRTSVTTTTNV